MLKEKKYTIYVNENCSACTAVVDYVDSSSVNCTVVNVDFEETHPPMELHVFPALFSNKRLLAYGEDIIRLLRQQSGRQFNRYSAA